MIMKILFFNLIINTQLPSAVFVGGQSTGYGATSSPSINTIQTRGNKMPSGIYVDTTTKQVRVSDRTWWPLSDLVETENIESPRSGIGNKFFDLTGNPLVVYGFGRGSAAWVTLAPGTDSWNWASAAIESYVVRGGTGIIGFYIAHGEGDQRDGTTRAEYAAILEAWQAALEDKANKAGMPAAIHPLYIDQMSNWQMFPTPTGDPTPRVVLGQYDAARNNPGRIILIGPKYHRATNDGVHLVNTASEAQGEQVAISMAHGPTWEPLWPSLNDPIIRSGATITIPMHIPSGNMDIDNINISDPGNYGFKYIDDDVTPPNIETVIIDGYNIIITLDRIPTGSNKKIQYALETTSNAHGGPTTGPRGCIKDSGGNYLVHFEETIQ